MTKFSAFTHPDLIHGNITRALIFFTLPLIISYVFQQFYNAADTVIIGHCLGETSLAAIGASAALFDLLVGFGLGFGNGLSIVAARAYGAGDTENLKKITAASLLITAAVTVVLMTAGGFGLRKVLVLLGTPAEIIEESYSYISTICLWCGVLFAFNLFSAMLRAIGNSFMPLNFLIFASIINVILDIFFITKCGMGIYGAAVATVIAQGASALLCLVYIFRHARILVPELRHFGIGKKSVDKAVAEKIEGQNGSNQFGPDHELGTVVTNCADENHTDLTFGQIYRELIAQGLSMAFMNSIVMSGTVILQSAVNSFGPAIIAGQITARKIFSITNLPILALGLSFSTFVSQNLGAGEKARIRRGADIGLWLTVIWTIAMLIFIPLTIKPLAAFISGSDNPEILDYAFKYMVFTVFFFFPLGGIFVTRNSLQGLGCKFLPLISSIIELCGKILFTVLIIPRVGLWGIILCEPLIWVAMCIHLFWAFYTHPVVRK